MHQEREAQQELDQLRTNLAKIEESVEMKSNTARDSRKRVKEITDMLADIGSGASELVGIEQDLHSAVSVCVGEGGGGGWRGERKLGNERESGSRLKAQLVKFK